MPIDHTEKAFENAIEDSLLNQGGYSTKSTRIPRFIFLQKYGD